MVAVDFVHFGPSQADVEGLRQQSSKNYAVPIASGQSAYWLLKGTTRSL